LVEHATENRSVGGSIPPLGTKPFPKGARIYVLQYGRRGREHRVTIGRHGSDVTAEQARLEACRLRGIIATGENPAITGVRDRSIATVADLGERYMIEYAEEHKKPSGIAQDRRNLNNHILPLVGKLLISSVESADVARVMRDVAAGKTRKDEKTKLRGRRIVRGGEIVANRVQALMSKMFELAEAWKIRPSGSNPCRGLKHYVENKVERFLSTDELARLGAALAAAECERPKISEVQENAPSVKKRRGGQRRIGPRCERSSVIAAYHCSCSRAAVSVRFSPCNGRMCTSTGKCTCFLTARPAPRRFIFRKLQYRC
jgi:Arm DNA-binding domain